MKLPAYRLVALAVLAVVWSTVSRTVEDAVTMALRPARYRKGHRAFRCTWKRQRRPRDALPPVRQTQLNLAWARARSQKKKSPTKRSKQTLEILQNILHDPVLSEELERYAGYALPQEVSSAALEAVQHSVRQVLGDEVKSMQLHSRLQPRLAVCLDRSLSQYDRNDLAMALEALGHAAQVTRHGVRIEGLEVWLGPAGEQRHAVPGGFCPFPCFHLTVAEDWHEADRLGQEKVAGCSETRWALDLAKRFSGERLPSLALRGRSQKGPVVMELVLRQLALRIQDRDAESLRRFVTLAQGETHGLGSRLMLAMAKEILEWSKSGLLGLWLKDAELYAGERGKVQASRLLNAAALQLDCEVWGLGHALSCPKPTEEGTPEAEADQLLTKGVRLVHFGCFDEAQEQLAQARNLLDHTEKWAEVHQRLSLAATLTDLFLQQRRGRNDKVRRLSGECAEALERLERRKASARPLRCWHNLPMLLRATQTPLERPKGKDPWPNLEATGATDPELTIGEPLNGQKMRRSKWLLRRLMPMTGLRFADDLELCRVQRGLAKILCD